METNRRENLRMFLCQLDRGATRIQIQGGDENPRQARIPGALDHCLAVVIEFIEIKMAMGISECHLSSVMYEVSGVKYLGTHNA